jgi:hypothetical protein
MLYSHCLLESFLHHPFRSSHRLRIPQSVLCRAQLTLREKPGAKLLVARSRSSLLISKAAPNFGSITPTPYPLPWLAITPFCARRLKRTLAISSNYLRRERSRAQAKNVVGLRLPFDRDVGTLRGIANMIPPGIWFARFMSCPNHQGLYPRSILGMSPMDGDWGS